MSSIGSIASGECPHGVGRWSVTPDGITFTFDDTPAMTMSFDEIVGVILDDPYNRRARKANHE